MYGQIHHTFARPSLALLQQLEGIWTSTLADTMGRHGVMMPEIRPIFEPIRIVGVAFTVLNYPNDNITTHKALTMLQPGDVLVIDEGRENNTGSFGHNMSLQARNRGAVGIVTNGCLRDIRLLRTEKFAAFCRGVCPRSAQKHTPGSINVPVHVGGLVISPGDIVVGVDTSPSGRGALTWAARYARLTGQRLRALHVFSYRAAGGVMFTSGGLPGMPAGGSDELRDEVEGEIRSAFDSLGPSPTL